MNFFGEKSARLTRAEELMEFFVLHPSLRPPF